MNVNRRRFIGALTAGAVTLAASPRMASATVILGSQPELPPVPPLLPRAMAALDLHRGSITHLDVIGIVDFSQPSKAQRFQLIDVPSGRVIATHLVAHGRGSDPRNIGFAEELSNRPGSNASCQGAFVTREIYHGEHGRSLRLEGLEPQNSLARERGIVAHAAAYVSTEMAETQGRVGRSEGCFAVSSAAIEEVLAKLAPGRLLFACK
jgi:hypothetical protein